LNQEVKADAGSSAEPATQERKPDRANAVWREVKGVFWVLVAVLAFHSFVAKPFYIPSESMMPVLLKGDRLVVSKYPFGWSWVSPSFHVFPHWQGRLLGKMPKRGDIVIVTPPGRTDDYIKRVIGLPGDRIEMVAGQLFINDKAIRRQQRQPLSIPIDENVPCGRSVDGAPESHVMMSHIHRAKDGREFCVVPVVRETLPEGKSYDTIELGRTQGDDFRPLVVPAGHLFLMGDNRDQSADSRFPLHEQGLGGPVPWENIGGRAEFITFSLDGSTRILNPVSWFKALRSGRAGNSLRGSAS